MEDFPRGRNPGGGSGAEIVPRRPAIVEHRASGGAPLREALALNAQVSIFDALGVSAPEPVGHVGPNGCSIETAFREFHADNPHVYDELVMLARRARSRGAVRIGIGMLFEVLRWRYTLRTVGDDFKLNNNYRSYYARLIMMREPDLAEIFETRQLHAGASL